MRLLRTLFAKKDVVLLHCGAWEVVDLIQKCMDSGVPGLALVFQYCGEEHRVGIESGFSEERGFFDIALFLDAQRFDSLSAFITRALVDGERFTDIRELAILRDRDGGNPWANDLLFERKIS